MRIVYLGTPDFAINPLKKLIECGYDVVAVVTNRDKPVGRKRILTPPPVKQYAIEQGIALYQYDKIRVEGVEDLKRLNPDVMITCAFGQILSKEIIDVPRLGVINIHASLLPRYRGASPIHYAILNGEKTTGITVMKTDVGIDTGDMILQREINIGEEETCGELFHRLSLLGAECIAEALPLIENGKAEYKKQDDNLATHTKIIKKEDAKIDFNRTAKQVYDQIRAFNPAPVAYCALNGEPFKVYQAEISPLFGKVGTILKADTQLIIACSEGAISFKKVQKAGGKEMDISDFLRGNKFNVGEEII